MKALILILLTWIGIALSWERLNENQYAYSGEGIGKGDILLISTAHEPRYSEKSVELLARWMKDSGIDYQALIEAAFGEPSRRQRIAASMVFWLATEFDGAMAEIHAGTIIDLEKHLGEEETVRLILEFPEEVRRMLYFLLSAYEGKDYYNGEVLKVKDVEGVGPVKFNWGSSYSHHIAARVKMPRHTALGDEIVLEMTFDNGSGENLYFSANSETVHCLVKIEDRRKRPCPYTTIGANLIGPHRGILMRGDSIPLPAGESVTLKIKLNDYFKFYKDDFRLSLEIPVSGGEAKYRKLIVKDVFFNIES